MMGMKHSYVFTAIAWALVLLCVHQTAAQSPGLTMNLVVSPDPVWPGGTYTVAPTYSLDTPAEVNHADAVFTISGYNAVTNLPAGCTAQTQYNYGEQTVVTCAFSGLQQGTHPLFDGPGITGKMDILTSNGLFVDGALNAEYAGGTVSGTASSYTGETSDVPGDSMAIQLVALTSQVFPGGTIIYDVLYNLQTSLLIDHSEAFFSLDPAINVTSVGVDCLGSGDSAYCGYGVGWMNGGTGVLSGVYGGVIEGVVDPLIQPGYQLMSSVSWIGYYDGGWGGLSATSSGSTRVGDPVAVPEFPGPEPVAIGLSGLAFFVFLAKRRQ